MEKIEACGLCGRTSDLRESHIIPRFVYKWIKDTSPGLLRGAQNPNLRIQDGPKPKLLGDCCEQRFRAWETEFVERFFLPVHENKVSSSGIPYGPWLLKFAASISWRTLRLYRNEENLQHLPKSDVALLSLAEATWRDFLLEQRPHPGLFEQHIVVVDAPDKVSGKVSPYLSRYLVRGIASDIVTSKGSCFTYTKLCRVIVLGFIRGASRKDWNDTKVHVKRGTLGGSCAVPRGFVEYLNEKADEIGHALGSVSPRQQNKINQLFKGSTREQLASSEVLRALSADVRLSGRKAFFDRDNDREE